MVHDFVDSALVAGGLRKLVYGSKPGDFTPLSLLRQLNTHWNYYQQDTKERSAGNHHGYSSSLLCICFYCVFSYSPKDNVEADLLAKVALRNSLV